MAGERRNFLNEKKGFSLRMTTGSSKFVGKIWWNSFRWKRGKEASWELHVPGMSAALWVNLKTIKLRIMWEISLAIEYKRNILYLRKQLWLHYHILLLWDSSPYSKWKNGSCKRIGESFLADIRREESSSAVRWPKRRSLSSLPPKPFVKWSISVKIYTTTW